MSRFFLVGIIIVGTLALAGCSIERHTYSLEIQVQGQGTVLPGAANSYTEETAVDVEAIPADGWQFYRWQGEVADPLSQTTTVLIDGNKTLRAIFVDAAGPTVLEAPGGIITSRADGSNVSLRPQGAQDIQYIMLHAISDSVANPTKPYQIERIRTIFNDYSVEAHYAIDRRGVIYQFVEDERIARHAGVGSWANNPRLTNNMNRYAIGIELLGIGTKGEMVGVIGPEANGKIQANDRGYTEEQYRSLDSLLHHLTRRYGIPQENIITHKDYDPGRKWDPGKLFDRNKVNI
jgi:hypothetical protein